MAKPEKGDKQDPSSLVIEYLHKQAKKYSTTDLALNLKIPKPQLLKTVQQLLLESKIQGKMYGKQYIVQSPFRYDELKEKMYQKELPLLSKQTNQVGKLVADLQSKLKKTVDLIKKLKELEIKYPSISKADTPNVPTEQEPQIDELEYKKLHKVYKARMDSFLQLQDVSLIH